MLVKRKLLCYNQTAPQPRLQRNTPVKLPPGPRMKPCGLIAIQAREDPRRVIGRAVLAADELNTRTEAASPETLTARETALEQAQGSRAATAGHTKNDQLPPFGNRRSEIATLKETSPNAMLATSVAAVISPKARIRDTETLGKSSIAALMCAEIGYSKGRSPLTCALSAKSCAPSGC